MKTNLSGAEPEPLTRLRSAGRTRGSKTDTRRRGGSASGLELINIVTNRFYISTKLIIAILCSGAVCGCSDGPVVIKSHAYESPNSNWVATLEEVDNGLGFGLGAVYDEVHLGKQGETIGDHGDKSKSVVFYVESTDGKGKPVNVKWLSNDRIQIIYDGSLMPGKKQTILKGVAIEYQTNQK